MWYIFLSFMNKICRDLKSDFALGSSLFRSIKLTKDADPDKYSCSGYGIGFNTRIEYSLPNSSICSKNIIIFGANMSS